MTQLEPGRFEIRVKIINPKTGKEKDIKRVVKADSPGAAAAMREELRLVSTTGATTTAKRLRLEDFATSWLNTKLRSLKPSTASRYASILDLHILPILGDHYLDAIEPVDVRMWLDRQKAQPSTINSRLRVLKTVLADAAYELALPRNPAARMPALREKRLDDDDPNRLQIYELKNTLADFEVNEPEWYPLILFIALTGTRFGEATSVKWSDIDEDRGLIHIRRSQ
ncbi:MAG: tyrosine-type recombinase/integrase family protein [Myxococcales bacterium]|nr:tyrosine-type recombinase/integrase family protein [Myxococcales bacterium]